MQYLGNGRGKLNGALFGLNINSVDLANTLQGFCWWELAGASVFYGLIPYRSEIWLYKLNG